jgi:hypothetical protein
VADEVVKFLPVGGQTSLQEAYAAYKEVTKEILDEDDWQAIPGKAGTFLKRSGWRKLATAYGVSMTILNVVIERDEAGLVLAANVTVRATHDASGRIVDGWGACSHAERKFSKREHDIPATAETRAKNRALADMFGLGTPSAEELETDMPVATDFERALLKDQIGRLAEGPKEELRKWWVEREFPGVESRRLRSFHVEQIIEYLDQSAPFIDVERTDT